MPARRALPVVLALAFAAVVAWLAYRGWSFYGLSMEDRVVHPDFRTLRASGSIGHGYGMAAAALVVLNLAYLVRRRLAAARLGPMWVWLDLHVFTGFLAAALATSHSAFLLRTPIAMTCAAGFALVVATGLVGRFLFALVPSSEGRLARALDRLGTALPAHAGAVTTALEELPSPKLPRHAGLVRGLAAIPGWRGVARRRVDAIRVLVPTRLELDRGQRAAIAELERAAALDARAGGMGAILRGWRGVHRFAAFLMIAAVIFHGVVAWHYGYRWMFG